MSTLVLRLAAPLQSWGTRSRFTRRNTDRAPSRSGVIGLLAAAKGVQRDESLDEFRALTMGVRIEQAGQLERDFQTARNRDGTESMPLSYRFYLADAVFVAAVQGPDAVIDELVAALKRPAYPLFLGRRSCPPAGKLVHGVVDGDVLSALTHTPWLAARAVRERDRNPEVRLDAVLDCAPGTPTSDLVQDVPLSFDPRHRQYGWRSVIRREITVPNPGREDHDPMSLL
ncbi:type I-E CRISPR-associated protein Cas5/CasD [Actinokineospora enzanensis]|uniref:type I-E CRISPR-associated protein Cas5/CasD n=1 Tax=Actinokineospora enzanensis TaxID=155975 RepID=UPI00037E4573|nr:type I-E CRISPR-associated protein Cas5/CasD [Actinokineospora enzanensis]